MLVLLHRAPFHIIMQKDQHASNIHIPSVFVSYAAGARILRSLQSSPPWDPVRVTLNEFGERMWLLRCGFCCICVVS